MPNIHGRVLQNTDKGAHNGKSSKPDDADGGLGSITKTLNAMLGDGDGDDDNNNDEGVDEIMENLYVVGWLKKGPTGTIATSVTDAKDTVSSILADFAAAAVSTTESIKSKSGDSGSGSESESESESGSGSDIVDPRKLIAALRSNSVVSWDMYEKINAAEMQAGQALEPQKPREKIIPKEAMLKESKSLR